MKFSTLKSIGHNISDSLGCGIGMMVGVYDEIDIYGEAAASSEGYIEVDFLTGQTSGGVPSPWMTEICQLYASALPALCERHKAKVSDFKCLKAKYSGTSPNQSIIVTVENHSGKCSIDQYMGWPARRAMSPDTVGRARGG